MEENINGVKKETNDTTICFNSLGWHNIAGKHYYCAGNRVIPEPNFRYTVSEKLSPFKLEIDDYLDQSEAVEAALKIKDISESTSMILYVAGFVGICRQIFHDAGVKVSAPIYLFAESQSGKTTLAEVATRMYNRSKLRCEKDILSTRVNSTIAKTEELISEGKDTVFLLDDLYDTSNKNTKKANENLVSGIIRNVADNTARQTKSSAYEPKCQLIITAEYMIRSKTDLGRCLLIKADDNILNEKLTSCENEPLALSTQYYYFIEWLSCHYDEMVSFIKEKFHTYREKNNKNPKKYNRLYEYSFILRTTLEILGRHITEVTYDIPIEKIKKNFKKDIKSIIKEQNIILEYLDNEEGKTDNLSWLLLDAIKKGYIEPGERGDQCYYEKDYIWITTKCFGKVLCNKYNLPMHRKKITNYFNVRYISETYSDNRQKRRGNIRYMKLNRKDLEKDAESTATKIESLFSKQ